MDLRIENINRGDSQSDLTNKLNYNFSQITSNIGGASGKTGQIGAAGDSGLTGPTGPIGKRGTRGNLWKVSETQPTIDIIEGDYWVDTANDCEVKRYQLSSGSLSWVSQNFLLSQAGVFEIDGTTVGLTSGLPNQAYVQNLFFPEKNTLILTNGVTADVKNPQLSKIVVGATGVNPLIEFSKVEYQGSSNFYSKSPKFAWGSPLTTVYDLSFLSTDGMDFEVGSFSAKGRFSLSAGEHNSADKGGITADFSQSIYLESAGALTMTFGLTSSSNPTTLSINSSNVTTWNDTVFTANLPIEISGNPINGISSFAVGGPLIYTKTTQPSPSENLFKASYRGIPGYSGLAGQDKDIYIIDSKGNNKFGKKITGYYRDPGTRSSTNRMGQITHIPFPFGNQDYFTIVAGNFVNTGNSTIDNNVNRYFLGEIFTPDLFYSANQFRNTLAIHVPNISSSPGGFGYLLSDSTESIKFCVDTGSVGFNSIYLDANSSNNPSVGNITVTPTNPRMSLLTGVGSTVYANFFEFTLIKISSTNYKLYYQASGGNIATLTSNDNIFISGVASTQ